MKSPPLAPTVGPMYFIHAAFPRLGPMESDWFMRADWATTIEDIRSGEIEDVIAVWEADPAAGTWRDVSERARGELPRDRAYLVPFLAGRTLPRYPLRFGESPMLICG